MGRIKEINVIVPAYNCGRYLDHCILSIFSQITTRKITVLISNDFSEDNTAEVLERIERTYNRDGFKITVFNQKINLKEIENTKFLLDQCNGEYIWYVDADDFIIDPLTLEKQIDFLEKNEEFSMCFTGHLRYINETGEYVPCANGNYWLSPLSTDGEGIILPEMIIENNPIGASSRVFRNYKNLILDYFDNFPFSDWPLNFEISLRGKIKYLEYPSYCYRVHKDSLTFKSKEESSDPYYNRVRILRERCISKGFLENN